MHLATLGGLSLDESPYKQAKGLLLVAYLALEGPQERRHVAELFYRQTSNPLHSLGSALNRLRKAVPEAIEANDKHVWTTLTCDAKAFLSFVEENKLNQAYEHYQGRFLEGLYLKDWGSELEDWVYQTREMLAKAMQTVLLSLAQIQAEAGYLAQAANYADQAYLLRSAPEPDADILKQLYHLLKAAEHPQASEVSKEAKAFGLSLELSSQDAKEGFKRQAPAARALHNLPSDLTPFVGRAAELKDLIKQLNDPSHRLISIIAAGGFGKTRLALAVARQCLPQFKDGVWFIPFVAVTSAELMVFAIAEAVGYSFFGQRDPQEQLADYLKEKEILLVLDNLEHLLEGVGLFADLLKQAAKLSLLSTSRERLHLHTEWVFELEGLKVPEIATHDAFNYDALKLFAQAAEQHQAGFYLSETNLRDITEICQLVGGMPLAIELAASWLRILPPTDIATEIRQSIDFLQATNRDLPSRHQSIRAVFDYSWKLMSPQEQQILIMLSVFQGGFSREAAKEIADADLTILASLADKALIAKTVRARYTIHPLIQEYCLEKLVGNLTEYQGVKARHGNYFLSLVWQAYEQRWAKAAEVLKIFDDEIENIWTSLQWAVSEKEADHLIKSAEPMKWYVDVRCKYQEALTQFGAFIEALSAESELKIARGHLILQQGIYYLRTGRYQEARQHVLRARALIGEDTFIDMTLNICLGLIALMTGMYSEAKTFHANSLSLIQKLNDSGYEVIILKDIANAAFALGEYEEAQHRFEEALVLARKDSNNIGVVIVLSHFGFMKMHVGRVNEALLLLEEGLQLARELGFEQEIARLLNSLGSVAYKKADFQKTQRLQEEALNVVQESGFRQLEAAVLASLGSTYIKLDQYNQAHLTLVKALAQAWSSQELPTVLELITYFAELTPKQGRSEAVKPWLDLVAHHSACPHWLQVKVNLILGAAKETIAAFTKVTMQNQEDKLREVVETLLKQPQFGA